MLTYIEMIIMLLIAVPGFADAVISFISFIGIFLSMLKRRQPPE